MRVHSSVLESLQLLISHGHVSKSDLESLRQRLLNELERAIHARNLALQSKMLHLLHATMTPAPGQKGHQRFGSISEKRLSLEKQRGQADPADDTFATHLTETISLAISTPSNRPVLQHWIDFLPMSSSFFGIHPPLLLEINLSFSSELRRIALHARKGEISHAGEAEVMMLLSGLDRILFLLGQPGSSQKHDDRSHAESGGMLAGLVSSFIVDSPAAVDSVRNGELEHLDEALVALLITLGTIHDEGDPDVPGKVYERARKLCEKLFKAHPKALIASLVRIWAARREEIRVSDIQ